mmetsp:Transcript_18082/g.28596  ORF Transcript_18082/g.28596 Transcript_18082/m.28596 type:complete len:132 (+) Transcript_18082:2-397(+)
MRDLVFGVAALPTYNALRKFTIGQKGGSSNEQQLTFQEKLFCGTGAGAFAAVVSAPFDTAKTRIMTRVGQFNSPVYYKNFVSCLKIIADREGSAKILSGLVPHVSMCIIGGAVALGAYEAVSTLHQKSLES